MLLFTLYAMTPQETFNKNIYFPNDCSIYDSNMSSNISYNLSSTFTGEPITLNVIPESDVSHAFNFYIKAKFTGVVIHTKHFNESNKTTDNYKSEISFDSPGFYYPMVIIDEKPCKGNKFFVYSYEYKASEKNEISQRNLMQSQFFISIGFTVLIMCISVCNITHSFINTKKEEISLIKCRRCGFIYGYTKNKFGNTNVNCPYCNVNGVILNNGRYINR